MTKKTKQKEMTREEMIKDAYRRFDNLYEDGYDIDVPDNRKLFPGDEVRVGNLKNCVVIETSPDFKKVVIEYTKIDNNYGRPITYNGLIGVWPWVDITKHTSNDVNLCVERPIPLTMINTDLAGLVHNVMRRGLIDNPDYQRGYVWTESDKVKYLDSVFQDRDLGKFIFIEDDVYNEYRLEVLDGKQRLGTIIDFYCSKMQYNGLYWHDLTTRDQNKFESRRIQFTTIDNKSYSRADMLKLFLDVNVAGVEQTEEHLQYVRELLENELKKEE